jgi:hypothetical protein
MAAQRLDKQGLPFAEDINYWKSGSSSPDKWLTDIESMIKKAGGVTVGYGWGLDDAINRGAWIYQFRFKEDAFKIIWPVLNCRYTGGEIAAKRQAATMLYHDIKAKLMAASVLGTRRAFFSNLLLPNGKTVADLKDHPQSLPSIFESVPRIEQQ